MKRTSWLLAGLLVLGVCVARLTTGGRPGPAHAPGQASAAAPRQRTPAPAPVTQLLSVAATQESAPAAPPAASSADTPVAANSATMVPEVAQAEFAGWVDRFLQARQEGKESELVSEGQRLAIARRQALALEIKQNPESALEHAVPWRWRRELPREITAFFEDTISGRGNFDVFCALPLPGPDYRDFHGAPMRYVTFKGPSYQAYVYGRRVRQMSQKNVALHGIVIDNLMAVHEDPVRLLEAEEAQAIIAAGKASATATCTLCGEKPLGGGPRVLLDYGGRFLDVCSPSHAAELSRTLAEAEGATPLVAAAQSGGDAVSGNSWWTSPPPVSPLTSFGTKRVLYMRIVFRDDTRVPITEGDAQLVMDEVNKFYQEVSYNQTALLTTVTPVLTLPHPKLNYAALGPGALLNDAVAEVTKLGYSAQNFDQLILQFTPVPSYDWGGLGGGGVAWLQGAGVGLIAHELGHCYGLGHANFWDTRRPDLPANPNNLPFDNDSLVGHDSVIGVGDDIEYGDIFDVMGSGGGESGNQGTNVAVSSFAGHFNAITKSKLAWLSDAYIVPVTQNGTNRIYAHDTPRLTAGRQYALRVRKDAQREYWVSARGKVTNPWLSNGVQLHWSAWQQCRGNSDLLDTTPGSKPGRDDGAILVGRTYADEESKVYITPMARGGVGTETWFEVAVYRGDGSTNNLAPALSLAASTNLVRTNAAVTLSASAADPNGDALAYFWDFGDGSFAPNAATVTKAWSLPGEYVVRCEVSDLRGGMTSKHLVVTVGAAYGLRISGTVINTLGAPVRGARVSNGSVTASYDLADDYQWTYTDSDGAFTLVNLTNMSYSLGAYLEGYVTQPLNFANPFTLFDQDADGLQFLAVPRPQVTVKTIADGDFTTKKSGVFQVSRTGDTNTALEAFFLLGGSAASGKDYATNGLVRVWQTNTVMGPFGPQVGRYQFYLANFPTGVVQTNIVITPLATNVPPGQDKEVALTIMYPLEVIRYLLTNGDAGTIVTNTNAVFFSDWEIRAVNGQDTWFQNYADYVPAWQGEAKVRLAAAPAPAPIISIIASAPTTENAGSAGMLTLMRTGPKTVPVTVRLAISGTAVPDSDYEALPGTVFLPANATFVNVPVFVRPNAYLDGNRTVIVDIVPDAAYTIGAGQANVVIVDNDLPLVTIAAVVPTTSEVTGTTLGAMIVTRTGDMITDLQVNYLVTGSATSGRDFRTLPGAINIPAGQATALIWIVPRDNGVKDGGNTVELLLSSSPLYNVGNPDAATVFIQDRALPLVAVTATMATAAEPGTAGQFMVTRSGDITRDLVVQLRTSGTAKPLADYAAIGSTVTIPRGMTNVAVTVMPVADSFREDPETVILEALPDPAYNVGPQYQDMVTINDGGAAGLPAVGFNFLTSSNYEGLGKALVAVSVSANPAPDNDVTVDYKVTGGTAILGVDYDQLTSTGRLVFPRGPDSGKNALTNRTQLITLGILNNTNVQPDRTLIVSLVQPPDWISNIVVTNDITITNADGTTTQTNEVVTNQMFIPVPMNAYFDVYTNHVFTILDDDAAVVTIRATDPVAWEEGLRPGTFTISRSVVTNRDLAVNIQITGLAANGVDYQFISNVVIIPAGAPSVQVPVIPVDNPTQEYIEDVKITLLSASGARIGSPSDATVTIINNSGTIEFTRTGYSFPENVGIALVGVRRTSATNVIDTVDFRVTAGTAAPGVNFVATNGTLTFALGEEVQYVPVTLLDDRVVQPALTVNLALSNPTAGGALGGQTTATLTILNADTSVQFAQAQYQVNENATNALITLQRLGVLTNDAVIDFAATNGTAIADVGFLATNATLTFTNGQTNLTVAVRILDNALVESNKTVLLTLSTNAGSLTAAGPQATAVLTLREDDCLLQFAPTNYEVAEFGKVVTLNVQRVGGTVHPLMVDYATTNGTAIATRNYLAASGALSFLGDTNVLAPDGSGTMIFQPGQTNNSFVVRILDNNTGEGNLAFSALLRNARTTATGVFTNTVSLGPDRTATVTILDDELPGQVDFAFNPGDGANAPVRGVALQPDAKVVMGGDFTSIDGIGLSHIARLQTDGYLDSFLSPGQGTDEAVHAVAVQPDGRILIGGSFLTVNGARAIRLARLNADGSLDTEFDAGAGANGVVRAIAVAADGTIAVGGDFSAVGGLTRAGIARLTADGRVDPTFDPGAGAAGGVYAVAVQPDGKVVLGGAFTTVAGANRSYLARLNADGSLDKSFTPGIGPDATVRSIALQGDGDIVIGGAFAKYSNTTRQGVARLNADGTLDTAFDPAAGPDAIVNAVGVQPDGKVVIAGAFTNVAGAPLNRFARLNPNGSVDNGFIVGTGADGLIRTLVMQSDTAFVIGGDFAQVNGLNRRGVARIHGDDKFALNSLQFGAAAYQVAENATNAVISVLRGGNLLSAVSVDYATRDGTALAGQDYGATQGTLNFGVGETIKTFAVPVFDDALAQGNRSFGLLLTNLPNGFTLVGQLTATVIILDNESAVAFSAANYAVNAAAGKADITVYRSGPSTGTGTVDYATQDGTAQAGLDYVAAQGTLVFNPGDTAKGFTITILSNDVAGPDKTVLLSLRNPTGGPVLGVQSNAVLTIIESNRVDFYNLAITPTAGGTVTPASGPYPAGSIQVLAASPDRDYQFVGWAGSVSSTANPLFLLMDRNYQVTARFEPVQFTYTFEPPFAAGDLRTAPWANSTTAPWQLQSASAAGGRFAVRSGAIGDREDTTLTLVVNTRAGAGSFDFQVSSEPGWDFFEFYVNGVKLDRWSGELAWQSYQFNLVAGVNTLTWRYAKDANFSRGADAAFVDNVYVPLDTPDPTPAAAYLTLFAPAGNPVTLLLQGRAGLTYLTEVSTNLTVWTPFSTNTLTGASVFIPDPLGTALPRRFYRAQTP